MSGSYFESLSNVSTKLLPAEGSTAGVVLDVASGITTDHTIVVPSAAPAAAAGYTSLLSVGTDGKSAWLPLQDLSGHANKNLVTDGSVLRFEDVPVAPSIASLSGNRTANSGGIQYVIHSVADASYKLQFATPLNPAALPALTAVNASEAVVGNQPTSIAVATTATANDSITFAWTPDAAHAKLVVSTFTDLAGSTAVGLNRVVTPIPDLAVAAVTMAHDAPLDHSTFTSGASNAVVFVFNRNLDTGFGPPTVATAGNGATSAVAYGPASNALGLTWTPAAVSAGNVLTVSGVRDTFGITYANVAKTNLTTVAALTAPSLKGRDAAGTNRVYLLTAETSNNVVSTFSRNIKKIVSFASTALPSGSSFAPVTNFTVAPESTSHVAAIATAAAAGTAAFAVSVIDTNDLLYSFTGVSLQVQQRLSAAGFTTTVNTQSLLHADVRMNFNRDLVDGLGGLSVTGSAGTVANFSTVAGDFELDYTTPAAASDTLSFVGVKDHADNDAESVPFAVTGLGVSPAFASWVLQPLAAGQNYAGTYKLVARFSVALDAATPVSGISVAGGGGSAQPTAIARSGAATTDLEFNWDASGYAAASTITFTFQNVKAADGATDSSEVATTVLIAAPAFASWTVQPESDGASVSPKLNFAKVLVAVPAGAPAMAVTASNGNAPSAIAVGTGGDAGRLVFAHTPAAAATVTYTVQNLHFADGSRIQSLAVANGPLLSGFNTTAAQDTGNSVLEDLPVNYTATFTKALSGAPSVSANGTGDAVASISHASNSVTFDLTAKADTTALVFGGVAGADGTVSTDRARTVVPRPDSVFVRFELTSNPGAAFTAFKVNQAYNLYAVFSQGMDTSVVPTLAVSAGSVPTVPGAPQWQSSTQLKVDWTPSAASEPSNVTVTFQNLRDAHGFNYSGSNNVASAAYDVTYTAPTVTGIVVEGVAGIGSKVKHNAATSVAFTFNKAVSNQPTVSVASGGTATYASGSGTATLTYSVTATALGATSFTFGTTTTTEGGSGTPGAQAVTVVAPITAVARIATQAAPATPVTAFDSGTAYTLCVVFDQAVSSTTTGVTVAAAPGADPTGLAHFSTSTPDGYSFAWTPDTAGSVTITTTGVRDSHGFVYAALATVTLTVNSANFMVPYGANMHFDASVTSSYTTVGGKVDTWTDLVGGVTFSQTTDAQRPTVTSQNGLSAFAFNGSNWMSKASAETTIGTFAIVFNNTASQSYSSPLHGTSFGYQVAHGGFGNTLVLGNENNGRALEGRVNKVIIQNANTPINSISRSLVNNMCVFTQVLVAPVPKSLFLTGVGTNLDDAAGRSITGTVCEVVFFPTALTQAQVIEIEDHLIAKWGVSIPFAPTTFVRYTGSVGSSQSAFEINGAFTSIANYTAYNGDWTMEWFAYVTNFRGFVGQVGFYDRRPWYRESAPYGHNSTAGGAASGHWYAQGPGYFAAHQQLGTDTSANVNTKYRHCVRKSGGTMHWYVDGISVSASASTDYNMSKLGFIGPSISTSVCETYISEVQIWSVDKGAAYCQAEYSPASPGTANLEVQLRLNNTLNDTSGKNAHATTGAGWTADYINI